MGFCSFHKFSRWIGPLKKSSSIGLAKTPSKLTIRKVLVIPFNNYISSQCLEAFCEGPPGRFLFSRTVLTNPRNQSFERPFICLIWKSSQDMDIAPGPFYPKYDDSHQNLLLGSPLWYFLIIWSGGPQGSGGPRGPGDWWWNIERQFDPCRSSLQ